MNLSARLTAGVVEPNEGPLLMPVYGTFLVLDSSLARLTRSTSPRNDARTPGVLWYAALNMLPPTHLGSRAQLQRRVPHNLTIAKHHCS